MGGGAAVAAGRLNRALRQAGVESKLLVQDRKGQESGVYAAGGGVFYAYKAFARFAWERLMFLPHERDASVRFAFSPANTGMDISRHPLVQEADVIHIHWINQGFLSLNSLNKLLNCGKPVVWTQHDMWTFTGGCHYAGECTAYKTGCAFCPFLKRPGKHDLSSRVFAGKQKIYSEKRLSVVACSAWLRDLAKKSALLHGKDYCNIPNPIDTEFYMPRNANEARDRLSLPRGKRLLLFGAANVNDPRKGMRYLMEALDLLARQYPNLKEEVELVVFGKMQEDTSRLLPFKTHMLNFISNPETLVDLYSAADVYVLPSLQDNLPNTVMEALACGTPVVAFGIGGVPEMVKHKEMGYLADKGDANSLAAGIYDTLLQADRLSYRARARQKVLDKYAEAHVAQQYIDLYKTLLR